MCWGQRRSGEHVVANLLFPVTASLTLGLVNLQPLPHHDSLFFLGKSLVCMALCLSDVGAWNLQQGLFSWFPITYQVQFHNKYTGRPLALREIQHIAYISFTLLLIGCTIKYSKHEASPLEAPPPCLVLKRMVIKYQVPISPAPRKLRSSEVPSSTCLTFDICTCDSPKILCGSQFLAWDVAVTTIQQD